MAEDMQIQRGRNMEGMGHTQTRVERLMWVEMDNEETGGMGYMEAYRGGQESERLRGDRLHQDNIIGVFKLNGEEEERGQEVRDFTGRNTEKRRRKEDDIQGIGGRGEKGEEVRYRREGHLGETRGDEVGGWSTRGWGDYEGGRKIQ
ncbi:hypothetical protein LIER_43278 [Lithospermum erythrorhizon]|uniref:Uncharacterized protein n=1 Tax=Lithospermum erythrorhizon TaxID=34254 RepID=A0AAV3PSI8_LITER